MVTHSVFLFYHHIELILKWLMYTLWKSCKQHAVQQKRIDFHNWHVVNFLIQEVAAAFTSIGRWGITRGRFNGEQSHLSYSVWQAHVFSGLNSFFFLRVLNWCKVEEVTAGFFQVIDNDETIFFCVCNYCLKFLVAQGYDKISQWCCVLDETYFILDTLM